MANLGFSCSGPYFMAALVPFGPTLPPAKIFSRVFFWLKSCPLVEVGPTVANDYGF